MRSVPTDSTNLADGMMDLMNVITLECSRLTEKDAEMHWDPSFRNIKHTERVVPAEVTKEGTGGQKYEGRSFFHVVLMTH